MRDDMISAIRLFLRKQGRSFAVADQVAQHISNHTPDNMVKEMRDYWIKEATKWITISTMKTNSWAH